MPGLTIATTINEVVALPIAYPATAAYPHEATHYLYIKAYTPRLPTEDTPRQLALANVPTDATEAHLKAIFANQLGGSRVETVAFDGAKTTNGIWTTAADTSVETVAGGEKRKRGQDDSSEHSKKKQKQKNGQAVAPRQVGELPSTWTRELHSSGAGAVITFADKASADSALREARKAAKSGTKIVWGQGVTNIEPLGRARYLEHHRLRYPPASELQASVNAYMAAYNTSEAVRARARVMASSQPDADGFVTVTRGARVAPAHTEAAKAKQEELRKRAKDRVKGDFYRFQLREQRKEGAKKLVAGFEEDQKRVEELRRRKGKVRPE